MSNQYGGGMPYPPMPGEPPRGPIVRGPAPPSVTNAVTLMLIRAALGFVAIIVTFATRSTLKREILKKNPTADAARLNSLLTAAIVAGLVVGIVFLVLYVLLALQVKAGKNWARIVTLILAALGAISALASLATTEPAISHVLGLIVGLIDVAVIILLAQKPSSQYFSNAP